MAKKEKKAQGQGQSGQSGSQKK